MDWSCLLLILVIVCPLLYIIYGAFSKLKKLIFAPIKRSKAFSDLESRDGFSKIRKDSEEHRFLNDILNEILKLFDGNKPLSIKQGVFQKDNYDYYICDIEVKELPGARYGGDPMMPNRYICLLINVPLNISEPLKVSKRSYHSLVYTPGNAFEERYSVFSRSQVSLSDSPDSPDSPELEDLSTAGQLLIRDVQEIFEAEDGRYPMTERDSNEFPGPLGRSAIFCDNGVILIGNPDGNRYNIAEMMNMGKKLLSLVKAITDNEAID